MPVATVLYRETKKLIFDQTEDELNAKASLLSATRLSSVMVGSVALRHQITLILLLSVKLGLTLILAFELSQQKNCAA
jgi:hypothetical protein